ncbi:integrase catalytic domain-containing protein [Trichonephila clavata]|uniref:Integrase catalytic domain-containing protein n=1 Tax=Trichonephila clavata TaxID=2740835 RepID=A0A8X6L466_TRICU|nr:integrase catalytic domain-containing protein [Trichonephila clavata]
MELKQLLQRGGMTLHKWCTNLSPTNAKEFPLDRNSEEIQVNSGLIWNSIFRSNGRTSLRHCPIRENQGPKMLSKISAIGVVLHGFADASSKAYGAVVYMQTVYHRGIKLPTLVQ